MLLCPILGASRDIFEEPTSGLEPLTSPHYECAVSGCWVLHAQMKFSPIWTWGLAAGPLSKVIDLPRRTLAAAALAAAHVRH
jgi:hypothetical protein